LERKSKRERKTKGKKRGRELGIETNRGSQQPRGTQAMLTPPNIWPRRQNMQKIPIGPTPIEEIERINTVVVRNPLQE